MKNYEILNINHVLAQIVDEPLKGKFKFKIFNIKAEVETKASTIMAALEGVEDEEERNEILEEEQEIKLATLTQEELENIDLSIRQIGMLRPIIEFDEE